VKPASSRLQCVALLPSFEGRQQLAMFNIHQVNRASNLAVTLPLATAPLTFSCVLVVHCSRPTINS